MTTTRRYNHCRFCKKYEIGERVNERLVKYGFRHYAHYSCYLDAGKMLTDLPAWAVGNFPYRLLIERGLSQEAQSIIATDKARWEAIDAKRKESRA